MNGDEVNKERFPLPALCSQLARCAEEVHRGKGISIIRGLRPSRYSAEENTILFLALADYIGDQRGIQNYKGAMLSIAVVPSIPSFAYPFLAHVTDSKSWNAPKVRRHGVYRNDYLVGLSLTLRTDKEHF